jgi:hypothetical protein
VKLQKWFRKLLVLGRKGSFRNVHTSAKVTSIINMMKTSAMKKGENARSVYEQRVWASGTIIQFLRDIQGRMVVVVKKFIS